MQWLLLRVMHGSLSPQAALADELGWPSPAELLRHVLSLANVPEGEAEAGGDEGTGGAGSGDEPYSYDSGGMATLPEEDDEEEEVVGAASLGGALEVTGSAAGAME